jgi:hypothetical protein
MFDLHPDGDRIAVAPAAKPPDDLVTFVFHFFEELRRVTFVTPR